MNVRKSGVWNTIGNSISAAATVGYTLTTLFTGDAGDQWYDLAQHGIGLYRITYSGHFIPHWLYYDGQTTVAVIRARDDSGGNVFDTNPTTAVAKLVDAAGTSSVQNIATEVSGKIARYVGSKGLFPSSSAIGARSAAIPTVTFGGARAYITKVERVTQ